MAPEAVGLAYGDVMAMTALASLDTGTNFVPNDMIAQIHAGERIIPAADNRVLTDMVAANANGGGNGGPPIIINVSAMDGQSVKRMLMDNKGHVAEAIRKYARDGGR